MQAHAVRTPVLLEKVGLRFDAVHSLSVHLTVPMVGCGESLRGTLTAFVARVVPVKGLGRATAGSWFLHLATQHGGHYSYCPSAECAAF